MLDFSPRINVFSDEFETLVDKAMQSREADQPKRNYLGASRLGVECDRALGYEYFKFPKDEDFNGRILRIFQRGHDGETRMLENLRTSGFTIQDADESGNQLGFAIAPDPETGVPRIAGHCDGVVTYSPLPQVAVPCLWENKVVGNRYFKKYQDKGIKEGNPVYYAQIQTYMGYLNYRNPGLFTVQNADTGELYAELIPWDAQAAQAATDRGVRVISARHPEELAKIARASTDWKCRLCDYAGTCWRDEQPKINPDTPEAKPWREWGAKMDPHDKAILEQSGVIKERVTMNAAVFVMMREIGRAMTSLEAVQWMAVSIEAINRSFRKLWQAGLLRQTKAKRATTFFNIQERRFDQYDRYINRYQYIRQDEFV